LLEFTLNRHKKQKFELDELFFYIRNIFLEQIQLTKLLANLELLLY